MTNAQIDALRNNRQVAEAVIDAATKDYVSVLQHAGQQITTASLYTVHLLGAPDAKKFFAASPGSTLADVYGVAHANSIVSGNPFLGTASSTIAQASAGIANFYGRGSSAVTAGALALQQQENEALKQQEELWQKIGNDLHDTLAKNVDISSELKDQKSIVPEIERSTLAEAAANDALRDHVREVTQEEEALKQMGDSFVEDVLNPDNWTSWGSIAHTVLADIMKDLERLALLNPIENWLNGNKNLPTLGNLFSLLGGGSFDVGAFNDVVDANSAALGVAMPHFAGGGLIRVNGGTDTNVLSINGQPRAMVSGDETLAVIPSNAVAASSGAGQSVIVVKVEPNDDRFDAYVSSIAGPLAAQAGTRGAYAGAGLARDGLAKRALHQLGSRG